LLHTIAVQPIPALPPLRERSERHQGTWYTEAIDRLLTSANVPKDKGGWYVWGRFNDAAWWQPIYVGKASPRKEWGLYKRLHYELREERSAMFAAVYGRDATMTAERKLLDAWKRASKNKIDFFKKGEGVQRALRKTDTHFIVWAEAPLGISEENIRLVENALIDHYRPSNNSKRPTIQEMYMSSDLFANARKEIDEEIFKMRGAFKI
jgi:hypothetical protein